MPDAEAREFLRHQKIAHAGTVDGNGWPYVVPLVYIYEGGESLYLHTGAHQGHFLTNLQRDPRICVEVSDIWPSAQGKALCLRLCAGLFERDGVWSGADPVSRSGEEIMVSGSPFGQTRRSGLDV